MKAWIIGSVLFVLSMNVSARQFNASTQKGVDLKKFETFTIARGEVVTSEENKVDRDQFYADFQRIVIPELERKGYRFIDDTTAHLTVSYVVETSRVVESENVGPLGQMPQRNSTDVQTQTWSRDFTRGALILTASAGRRNPVWSTEGSMDVARTRGGNVLEYAIRQALKDFPDKNKKARKQKGKKKG